MTTHSNDIIHGPNDGYGYDSKTITAPSTITINTKDIVINTKEAAMDNIFIMGIGGTKDSAYKKSMEKMNDKILRQTMPKSKIKLRKTSTAKDLLKLFEKNTKD